MANAPSPNDLTRQQLDELDALLQRMLALPAAKPPEPSPAPKPLPLPDPTPAPAVEASPAPAWRTDRPTGPPAQAPHLTAATATGPEPAEMLETLAGIPRSSALAFAPTPAEPVVVTPGVIAPEPAPPLSSSPVAFAPTVTPTPAEPFAANRLFGPPMPEAGVQPTATPPAAFEAVPPKPTHEMNGPAQVPDFGPIEFTDEEPAAGGPVDTPPDLAMPTATVPVVPVLLLPLFAVNWVLERALGLFGPPGQSLTSPGMKHLLGGTGILLLAAAGVWTARGLGWIELPLPRSW